MDFYQKFYLWAYSFTHFAYRVGRLNKFVPIRIFTPWTRERIEF